MNTFHAIIFLHVTGAIDLFVTWALEYKQVMIVKQFPNMDAAGNTILKELKKVSRTSMAAMLITLGTGIWLMAAFWGQELWMMMAFLSLLLIIFIGIFFSRRASLISEDKTRSFSYLISSIRLRIAIGAGIIALMVFKTTTMLPSLLIVFVFLTGGILWVLPVWKMQKNLENFAQIN